MNLKWLSLAYREALKAKNKEEVPVGAVIVHQDRIIARAHNLRESKQSSLCHAEILAIQKACKKIGSWRLEECDLYVTLEPCVMCAGAIQQSRIRNVYYGARDLKAGVISLNIPIHNHPNLNHRYKMEFIDKKECGEILSDFFRQRRLEKRRFK